MSFALDFLENTTSIRVAKEHLMKKVINGPVSLRGQLFPFAQAVAYRSLIFVSGQVALDHEGNMVGDNIAEQTSQVISNLSIILATAGASLSDVVKTTIWLTRVEDFAGFNEEYSKYFMASPPARATVCSALVVPGALVEIEAIAIAAFDSLSQRELCD
jgi:2-iminobutanoate/2-iminopropanoate deaminase